MPARKKTLMEVLGTAVSQRAQGLLDGRLECAIEGATARAIDKLAEEMQTTRSATIRMLLSRGLAAEYDERLSVE